MADTSQQRTERATPKRLRDARRRGDVPRSRELATAAIMGATVLALVGGGRAFGGAAISWLEGALQVDPAVLATPSLLPIQLGRLLGSGFLLVLPVLAAAFAAALLTPLLLGGWNLAPSALMPKLGRLDPLAGLGRMVSSQALVELGKALLKIVLLGGLAVLFCRRSLDEFLALGMQSTLGGIGAGFDLCVAALLWMTGGLAAIAAVDAPYQLWKYHRQLRMTRQEIRDEMKESEGRPEVKARIRRLQHEMAQRRMMEAVPKADVVVTNPTHYAVALRYEAGGMRAPRVVAKGADLVAQAIRELAQQHRVVLVEAPPLARALYRSCKLDTEIPMELYTAVAQVLGYVYQLRAWRGGPAPKLPQVGTVPGGEADPPTRRRSGQLR